MSKKATESQTNKFFTAQKNMIMKFADEYGYEYIDNDKVVVVKGDDKKIRINIKQQRFTDMLTGYSDNLNNVTARLMILFGKFNYKPADC